MIDWGLMLRGFIIIALILMIVQVNYSEASALNKIHAACHAYAWKARQAMSSEFGYDAIYNKKLMITLIYQESRCKPMAKSAVGARGLGQMMPKTAKWMGEIDGKLKGLAARPYSVDLQIKAVARYLRWLRDYMQPMATDDDTLAAVLSAYNGGIAYVYRENKRDRLITSNNDHNANIWFDNVELFSNRSKSAFKENRHYVDVIINKWMAVYRGY